MSHSRTLRAIAARLALAFASLALTLGVFEVGLRVAGHQPLYAVYSKPSLLWQHDPLLGWAHTPGARDVFVGPRPYPIEFETPIAINSHGLRGPELRERTQDSLRVLFLGDSAVAGFEVAYADTFVARLERLLAGRLGRPVEVLNGGVRGYGTDQSYLYYRERGFRLDADLVLFMHSANDPENNMTLHRLRRPFGKPAFTLSTAGELAVLGSPVPDYPLCAAHSLNADYRAVRTDDLADRTLCWLESRLGDHSALFAFSAATLSRVPGLAQRLRGAAAALDTAPLIVFVPRSAHAAGDDRAARRLTAALIGALSREVRTYQSDFLLIVRPDELQRLGKHTLESLGVEWAFAQMPLSDPTREPRTFRNDPHVNEHGHRLIAEALVPVVMERLAARLQAQGQGR